MGTPTTVKPPCGPIHGTHLGGVYRFRTIAYAQAPVGDRRFAPPVPLTLRHTPLDATSRGTIFPQGRSSLEPAIGSYDLPQSEDSLTLAITTPSLRGRLPVAVFIHGGANCFGGGNLPCYDGEYLSQNRKVVVVNVNFRLGAFGYLYHPALNTENLAQADITEALIWVQNNIAAFGGDPSNVTLFGQSAGANAILDLIATPETEGLFSKVILQSPSIGRGHFSSNDAIEIAEALFDALGVDAREENFVETMQAIPAEKIVAAMASIRDALIPRFGNMLFKPVSNAWESPENFIKAVVQQARRRHLSLVIGTTHDEMHAFTSERGEAVKAIQMQRYECPARKLALALAQAQVAVWKYRFDWKAPASPYDACHCIELPFVFGTWNAWDNAKMLAGLKSNDQLRLTDTLQSLWSEFFIDGAFDTNTWPKYHSEADLKIFL